MASSGQMSNEQSTRNGIQALESAFSGIMRCRQDVDGTRAGLAPGYGGEDGRAYGQLLEQWDAQCNVILKNLEDMIDKLNTSLQHHHKTQGSANDAINQAFSKADAAFQDLVGS